jgi:hypothetical protein
MRPGLIVGRDLSDHGSVGDPVGVPLETATRHMLFSGATGAGKTVIAARALLSGHAHSEGLSIVVDPKGDLADLVTRGAYARTGTLDDVYCFDAMQALPKLSFFDLRPALDAGIDRFKVMTNTVGHFLDLTRALNPTEHRAIRAPRVIANLLRANFDPVTGDDVFGISDLMADLYALRRNRTLPEVSAEWDEQLLTSHEEADDYTLDKILQGAVTRTELLYGDNLIRPLLDYAPADPTDAFRFDAVLDEDALLILDLSSVHDRAQRALSHVVLSTLWRSLQRSRRDPQSSPSTVLLFIDEVPQLDIGPRLADLIELGRRYGLGIGLIMQYPRQLDDPEATPNPYETVLNNVQSIVTGRVPEDQRLISKLADDLSKATVEERLKTLPQSHVLAQIATPYGERRPPTQQFVNPKLPHGHPDADGPRSFSAADREAYATALAACGRQTATEHGITPPAYTEAERLSPTESDAAFRAALQAEEYRTLLPVLDLPDGVTDDAEPGHLQCSTCEEPHPADSDGYLDALRCHAGDEEPITREAIPPIDLGLALDEAAIDDAPISIRGLVALQVLHNLHTNSYSEAFDRVHDRPLGLFERVPVTTDDLDALAESGFIRDDHINETRYPTVTDSGRDLIDVPAQPDDTRDEIDGPQTDSLLQDILVEGLVRLTESLYVEAADSPITRVVPARAATESIATQGRSGQPRFDVVGLDEKDTIHLVGVAHPQDRPPRETVATYNQIATLDPAQAIWAVPDDERGHTTVIDPLTAPPSPIDDRPQPLPDISRGTSMQDIVGLDEDGCSEILTLRDLRHHVPEIAP